MLNHITLMGRLVRDPELRRTQQGTAVTSFAIACEDDFKNADGSKNTVFIDCVAWRNTAEYIAKYFGKGRMMVVSGRLTIREWTDRNDNKRKTAEIIVENAYFGDSRPAEGNSSPEGYSTVSPVNVEADAYYELTDDDENLPY